MTSFPGLADGPSASITTLKHKFRVPGRRFSAVDREEAEKVGRDTWCRRSSPVACIDAENLLVDISRVFGPAVARE